ncbi:MAG: hypothetical protein IJ190_03500, partial [Prevotella sp.]|nr:hypothetical protein [Prevotella sp.]
MKLTNKLFILTKQLKLTLMKKLFTLMVMALVAMSVSATVEKDLITDPVNLDDGSTGWYPGYVIDRANFTSVPVGTKLIVEYTLNAGSESHGFRLCTNYSNTPLPGFEEADADHNYYPTADGSYTYEITQETIDLLKDVNAIQYDNVRLVGTGVTANRVYLQLADEEAIATESINLDDGSTGWYPGYIFSRDIITSAEVGWHIVIDYTLNAGAESHGFRLCTNYSNTPLPGFEESDADHNYYPTADGSYSYEITQETIDLLKDVNAIQYDNVRLVGTGVTITALKLVRKAAEEGGEEAGEATALIDYPTKKDGITIGSGVDENNSQKYHANTDEVANISFGSGYITDGVINGKMITLSVEGGFKTGDKVIVAGYFNNSDETKQAAVQIFTGA